MAKKANKGNHISRTERERIALEKARFALPTESIELQTGVEIEISTPSEKKLGEELLEKNLVASRNALLLPEGVMGLFELTRDGKPTPKDLKEAIVGDPSISCEVVYEAIYLGIQAGTYVSYQNSKER